eukprot:857505-Prymnesium_polylepis.1
MRASRAGQLARGQRCAIGVSSRSAAPISLDAGWPSTTPSTTKGSTDPAERSLARERLGFRLARAGEPPSSSASRACDAHPVRCRPYLAFVFAGRPPRSRGRSAY